MRYGVAEWYGHIVAELSPERRRDLAGKAKLGIKQASMPCPFRQEADSNASCNKKAGVCTLRQHRRDTNGRILAEAPFVTMCPNRFWHDNQIFRWIGNEVLGTSHPTLIKEVDFLEGLPPQAGQENDSESEVSEKDGKPVGRIDLVLMHPENPKEWCALELQGVYFSGESMASHLDQYVPEDIAELVWPDKNRRPDWRSSGPKRLMPQLQTKIPTLRRWGKKMTVVIDKPFRESLGSFAPIKHLSNADIAWFVVDYDTKTGTIKLVDKIFTTLESSVEALTAGIPRSRDDFENKLATIVNSKAKAMKKKVIRLA
jgi:Restriction endonuclease NotI